MKNRMALGLAVGAGYVLGRTKKAKLAFGIGTMVMGKKLKLSPQAISELVGRQLRNNPQFKEIGDQLRQELQGVGKAATGALVNRQINGLADRLHSRTEEVQDIVSGVVPDIPGKKKARSEEDQEPEETEEPEEPEDFEEEEEDRGEEEPEDREERGEPEEREGRGGGPRTKKAPSKKAAAGKPPAKKAPAKKTASAKRAVKRAGTGAREAAGRPRPRRGGGDRD
ncbi:DNA primase [Streptomyces sp. GC420]|uniref:DNA primase n=1 Tax=Streptomyces sp. GC420 TaxID=2697568 RepID=UPI0014151410|nr:DNA primase [Streptomyces sp. GC420]NBM20139.1 DNA primase [Streptomyces sp. GC420]